MERFCLVGSTDGSYSSNPPVQSRKRKSDRDNEHNAMYRKIQDETSVLNPFLVSNELCLTAIRKLKEIHEKEYYITKEYLLLLLARIIRKANHRDGSDHRFDKCRDDAYDLVGEVVKESSRDLFLFMSHNKRCGQKGKVSWGRGLRTMIKKFYEDENPETLARDIMHCKKDRDFAHRDLIRQCHVKPDKHGEQGEPFCF